MSRGEPGRPGFCKAPGRSVKHRVALSADSLPDLGPERALRWPRPAVGGPLALSAGSVFWAGRAVAASLTPAIAGEKSKPRPACADRGSVNQLRHLVCVARKWLPDDPPCKNLVSTFVLDLVRAKKRLRDGRLGPPPVVKMLEQAEEWDRLLRAGIVQRRAQLARRYRVSRARVTQLMRLLTLAPPVLAFVRQLGDDIPTFAITERALQQLVLLDRGAQLEAARQQLKGFAVWERHESPSQVTTGEEGAPATDVTVSEVPTGRASCSTR